ncbi:MAG: protein jag [Microlunatus sp.]|nr:protein jag [Microlunatus sp.]
MPAPRRDGGAESDDTDADTGDDVDAEDVEGGDAESVDPEDRDIASGGIDSADPEGGDAASGDTGNGDTEDDNPLEVEAEVAADYLEELLDIADLDGDIDTYIDGDRAHVSIVSESDILVGKNGQVLDALQELTRLAVLADTGQRSRLMLDVAGFRAKRRVELVALASDAAQEAKDTSEPVHLTAMNPFERKIVHDAVAAAGLTSESEGEEPRRHVVVLPVGD